MKGVVLTGAPGARLVDISHHVPPFNLRVAWLILEGSFPYFPQGSIHVMVVDPGVGSVRRHLFCKAGAHFFIGPDNGVLGRIVKQNQGSAFQIDSASLGVTHPGNTFHGRDIYALAAGKLLAGVSLSSFASPITDTEVLHIPEPRELQSGIQAESIHIDHFGNIVTNLRAEHLRGISAIRLGDKDLLIVRSYSELDGAEPGLILNSWGYYEITCSQGSAAYNLGIPQGRKLLIGKCSRRGE